MMDTNRVVKAVGWAVGVIALSILLTMRNGEVINWPKVLIGGVVIGVAEYAFSSFENRRK
ncbi:MAG: hypothetical protein ACI4UH_05575 [Dorea sp.]